MSFQKAVRRQKKLRLGLAGPPGAGKTLTALRFAMALARFEAGTQGKVAVIDTENKSASLYANEVFDGHALTFDVDTLDNYAPTSYTTAIREAGRLGYHALVVDSWTHAWTGEGGALDMKDKAASKAGNNNFTAWRDVTPLHNAMIEALLQSPCHVIVTMRTKIEYEMVQEERNGKMVTVPRKIGMKVIQREGAEYEFDVFGDMESDTHLLKITKTRCSRIDQAACVKPGEAFLRPVMDWLSEGAATTTAVTQSTEKTAFEKLYERLHSCETDEQIKELGKEAKTLQSQMKVSEFDLLVATAKERRADLARKKSPVETNGTGHAETTAADVQPVGSATA